MPKPRARPGAQTFIAQPIPRFPATMMTSLAAAQEAEMASYRCTLALVHEREQEKREKQRREREQRDKDLPPVPVSPFVRPDSQAWVPELPVTKSPAPVSESRPLVEHENRPPIEPGSPRPPTVPSKSPRSSVRRNPFASRENLSADVENSTKKRISSIRSRRPFQNMGWLNEQFPHVKPSLILKIVRYEFEPMDLACLDPDRQNDTYGEGCFWTDYLTIESVVAPLAVYFRILQSWVAATSRDVDSVNVVSQSALAYISHLHELNEHFEWIYVLQYHMAFHERQRTAMRSGEYSPWSVVDSELVEKLLIHHPRPRQR